MKPFILLFLATWTCASAATTPGDTPPPKQASSHLRDMPNWQHIRLKQDAGQAFLLVEMQVGNQPALFLLDTGAGTTALRTDSAKRMGLELTAAEKPALQGVGGIVRQMKATIKGLKAGSFDLGVNEISVLPLNVLANRNGWGGNTVDGVLGSDLLEKHRIIVDVPGAMLHIPESTASTTTWTGDTGLDSIGFNPGKIPSIQARIGEASFAAVLDTGASGLLLDEGIRKQCNLPRLKTKSQIKGLGGGQDSDQTFCQELHLGTAVISNNGADVADLSRLQGNIRMLAGIHHMRACSMVLDYGSRTVHLKPGAHAGEELGTAGPILLTKEQIIAKVESCRTVATGRITDVANGKQQAGDTSVLVTFRFRISSVLAGEGKPGDEVEVPVMVPADQSQTNDLKARANSGAFGLLFQHKDGQPHPLVETLLKDSEIRRTQIRGMTKTP